MNRGSFLIPLMKHAAYLCRYITTPPGSPMRDVGCSGVNSRKLGATASCYMGSVVGHVTGHVMANANSYVTPSRPPYVACAPSRHKRLHGSSDCACSQHDFL